MQPKRRLPLLYRFLLQSLRRPSRVASADLPNFEAMAAPYAELIGTHQASGPCRADRTLIPWQRWPLKWLINSSDRANLCLTLSCCWMRVCGRLGGSRLNEVNL